MFSKPHCPVIAIEEHYWDEELAKTYVGGEAGRPGEQQKRLYDFGPLRLKEMDDVGIDMQVISLGAPSTQKLPAETACWRSPGGSTIACMRRSERTCSASPPSPALPTAVPEAAADEFFERCVKELGFKGAMLHGLANGTFLDDKKFWPIFARAEKLDVPIYLHPALPQAEVSRVYYDDYVKRFSCPVARPAWGYTVETGDHRDPAGALRRVRAASEAENHPRPSRC